ncbi:hypothetical protein GCM10010172_00780 [Paractinoplanes ferrugineus]|uniref:ABC transporter domain-containing protein n=1 Tax=Paractinoplanes ferrugineus TaxID=113564 RepID=A0A919J4V0_9ACTN|nr:hypothetical protein Afe05nite_57650 [Actinoplanes ferrugineus]
MDVLQSADMLVDKPSVIAIVGASGSGKTSTLNLIAGLAKPTSGTIEVLGVPLTSRPDGEIADLRARSIGFVF